MRPALPACTVFTRRSGANMSDGLPGLYTVDGFYKVVLPMLPRALTQVANDSWVLGKQSEFNVASPQAATLQQDVVKLYTDEYAANWDAFLADLDLPPLTNSQQSVQTLYMLSSPQSPMRDMLTAIVKQLKLTQAPPVPPTAAGAARRRRARRRRRPTARRPGCRGCWARRPRRPNLRAKRSRTATTR